MKPWIYKGRPVEDLDTLLTLMPGAMGFIYRITHRDSGKLYVGWKRLYASKTVRVTAEERKTEQHKLRQRKKVRESDWRRYHSSCAELKADIKRLGHQAFDREILELCCNQKYLGFAEICWQIRLQVLSRDSYNANIMGRYYRRDMENCPEQVEQAA